MTDFQHVVLVLLERRSMDPVSDAVVKLAERDDWIAVEAGASHAKSTRLRRARKWAAIHAPPARPGVLGEYLSRELEVTTLELLVDDLGVELWLHREGIALDAFAIDAGTGRLREGTRLQPRRWSQLLDGDGPKKLAAELRRDAKADDKLATVAGLLGIPQPLLFDDGEGDGLFFAKRAREEPPRTRVAGPPRLVAPTRHAGWLGARAAQHPFVETFRNAGGEAKGLVVKLSGEGVERGTVECDFIAIHGLSVTPKRTTHAYVAEFPDLKLEAATRSPVDAERFGPFAELAALREIEIGVVVAARLVGATNADVTLELAAAGDTAALQCRLEE